MRTKLFIACLLSLLAQPSFSQGASETLLAYAVNVHRTPMQTWGPGYGIYLGGGLFITAAHVVGRAWMTRPKIAIGDVEYPTKVVKEGSFNGTDVTLLSVDPEHLPMRLGLRKMLLCKSPPQPGQRVVTVVPEKIAHSQILDPRRLPAYAQRFNTVIADVAETGASGSGVFDLKQRCLLGIMSRKITSPAGPTGGYQSQPRDIAKYFVPAMEIAVFLPDNLRSSF
jgi:trypsin-like peptidase